MNSIIRYLRDRLFLTGTKGSLLLIKTICSISNLSFCIFFLEDFNDTKLLSKLFALSTSLSDDETQPLHHPNNNNNNRLVRNLLDDEPYHDDEYQMDSTASCTTEQRMICIFQSLWDKVELVSSSSTPAIP